MESWPAGNAVYPPNPLERIAQEARVRGSEFIVSTMPDPFGLFVVATWKTLQEGV